MFLFLFISLGWKIRRNLKGKKIFNTTSFTGKCTSILRSCFTKIILFRLNCHVLRACAVPILCCRYFGVGTERKLNCGNTVGPHQLSCGDLDCIYVYHSFAELIESICNGPFATTLGFLSVMIVFTGVQVSKNNCMPERIFHKKKK